MAKAKTLVTHDLGVATHQQLFYLDFTTLPPCTFWLCLAILLPSYVIVGPYTHQMNHLCLMVICRIWSF
ncbi:hypothetical protein K443DRAFT_381330 [Laccaria amethystina LaAM-08-1]|uniref:Uncharacterized protein n=1 Tax=Laccaria amethystina LaAM-08-1 TaxID=1095629 RepID=A0A0C9WXT5_9AGAR|nr:hypothetical protein K443DRAFT_381330 [Laccaria amethystina LaAM-08-1]